MSALYTGRLYWHSFLLEAESPLRPHYGRKGYVKRKIPMTASGIDPATLRLVAQCPNQLHHPVPPPVHKHYEIKEHNEDGYVFPVILSIHVPQHNKLNHRLPSHYTANGLTVGVLQDQETLLRNVQTLPLIQRAPRSPLGHGGGAVG